MSLRIAAMLTALIPLAATPAARTAVEFSPVVYSICRCVDPIGDSSEDLKTGYTLGVAADLRVPTTLVRRSS